MKGFGDKKRSKSEKFKIKKKKFEHDQLVKKAFEFQAQGKKLEAAKYYSYLIKDGLKDYRVFSNYGTFLKEIGKYQEAELELNKAIKLNPRYANAFYNLAGLFLEKGNLLQAEIYLKQLISSLILLVLTITLIYLKNMGKLGSTITYSKALEIDPHLTDAYLSFNHER